ncbi:MAG: type I-E CRISPR-associated protein Cas7/Cse4/CasC [Clostridia bacterium]|nr:type I-E CRISPR-associated protein Cas7/Cse4/CasC [Clostridia bacterium]
MLIDIHMLKNYPPVNLNRDDTGSPKTCWFGGVQRGRISSQCQKRSWRKSDLFEKDFGEIGVRTRALPALLGEELRSRGCAEEFVAAAMEKATGIANKDGTESEKGITGQIIFYSPQDITAIADRMVALLEDKENSVKEFKKLKAKDIAISFKDVKTRPVTLDIAMFGRMVTSDAFRNVEASVQVSHAISTHAVNQESDYFTAADDLLEGTEETGAGMIGDIDYNSCCYYQYVSIDTDQLRENLKYSSNCEELVEKLLPAFIRIMSFSDPSGKQNSFAGHVLPSLMCVEIKPDKIPVSYANAFAKPVNVRKGNVVGESVDALVAEIDKQDKAFGIESTRFWFCPDAEAVPQKAEVCASLNELCERVSAPEFRG